MAGGTKPRGFGATFVLIAICSAIPFGALWALLYSFTRELPTSELIKLGALAGVLFGILFGLAMAFLMKGTSVSVSFDDKQILKTRLDTHLSQIGYRLKSGTDSKSLYSPTWRAGVLAGRIWIEWHERQAKLTGPKTYVTRILRRLSE